MSEKVPSQAKSFFRKYFVPRINAERPRWTNQQVEACIAVVWYAVLEKGEKIKYKQKDYQPPTAPRIPIDAPPPKFRNLKNETQAVRDWADDSSNWPSSSQTPADQAAPVVPSPHPPASGQEASAERETTVTKTTAKGTTSRGISTNAIPTTNAPTVAPTSASLPREPHRPASEFAAEATLVAAPENEVTSLRRQNAQLAAHASGQWPNLSHIPPTPSLAAGVDPTGHYEEEEIFYLSKKMQRYDGKKKNLRESQRYGPKEVFNDGHHPLRNAAKFDRIVFGEIEARDGNEVLRHDGGVWKFRKLLGVGGSGMVTLWEKVDGTTSEVIDRIAVKEEENRRPKDWIFPLEWRNQLPIEISIHEQIKKIEPPCPYLMPSLGYRLNLKQRRYRLYLPYQPGGDMPDLMELVGHGPPGKDYQGPSLDFVFYTFLAMTEACLALDSGWWGEHQPQEAEMRESEGRKEGWVPIVHRDIKPGNTFMGETAGDRDQKWTMYPTPIVGDFGNAFETYPDDQYNPENWVGLGTQVFMAPEQRFHRPYGMPTERKLSDRTNVFGIAATIFTLWQNDVPGFWGQYVEDEDFDEVRERDDEVDADYGNMGVLPAAPNDEHVKAQLLKHYKEYPPPRKGGGHVTDVQKWLDKKYTTARHETGGKPGKPMWVYLFELEFWKPHWLLRLLNKDGKIKGFDNDNPKEHRLADILRECLAWDADVRPSILKLRNMVKAAIDELKIEPDDSVDHIDDTSQRSDMQRKVRFGGGLVYPMDGAVPGRSVEKFVETERRLPEKHAKTKALALWEAYRRTRLQRLRRHSVRSAPHRDEHLDYASDSGGEFGAMDDNVRGDESSEDGENGGSEGDGSGSGFGGESDGKKKKRLGVRLGGPKAKRRKNAS